MKELETIQILQEVLKTNQNFCSLDGELLKNNIIEAGNRLDPELLRLLLGNEKLSKVFFRDIDGIKVFDKVHFQKFILNKQFLPDSYTVFKNKIGLTNENDQFIADSREVILEWPYKDCVLEGGQTKEEAKRQEIFWNEILAPDEINRLVEPKAFSGFKRFDKDGEHDVDHLSMGDNLIIKGNNLLSLYSLAQTYKGRVRLIYIDPPYYFKKLTSEDNFQYNSNFHLSTWLTFMRNRLEVAKILLANGGTIWINIGEDGMHYLKVMADEVFGKEHFVGTLPRRTRNGKSDVPFNFSQDFDWILVYTNVDDSVPVMGRSVSRQYYNTPDYPGRPWRLADLTKQTTAKERSNSFFTMVNPKNGDKYPASEKRTWMVTKDSFQDWYDKGAIVFPGDYDFLNISVPYSRKFKDEDDKKGKLSAVISDIQIKDFLNVLLNGSKNKQGNDQIDDLFGRDAFSYAKPEELIKAIIEVTTSEGDLVLDFFSGSGTTAAVAHKMHRHYIACEQIDHQIELVTSRLQKVIAGDDGGVSNEVGWKGGGSFVYCELAKANQQYVEIIEKANSNEDLVSVWKILKDKAFLSYKVKPSTIDNHANDFNDLSIDDKKRFLIECLDKNMLYIPYSDMESKDYIMADNDKRLTEEFYKKK